MNIGVNARLLLQNKLEGIGWFSYQILKRITQNHPEHTFYFFFDRPYNEAFIFSDNVKGVVVSPQARHPILYQIWFNIKLPFFLKKYKIDVFFSPEGLTTLKSKIPSIITLHDLAYCHYPDQIDIAHRIYLRKYQPKMAAKAAHILTVSSFTKEDIIKQYSISEDKISIVYNAANSAYKPLSIEERTEVKKKYSDGREYFLFVGAIHPRKNVINLLKAFVQFKRRQKSKFKLIIVGRMAWNTDEIQEAKERMPYREDVIWLGYQNVDELTKIVGAAYALVYPSLFEGFGIPIIEAMACNVPSITSNTSSMPEVAGKAGLLVDPHNPAEIAQNMMLIYKDENLRNELIQECQKEIQRFDWDKSAEQIWEKIFEVANSKLK